MPVTAKWSKAFYEKFGDQAAGELVNWMNTVHEDARADLREFNELNFARFDAKLDQRVAGIEARFNGLEARFDGLEARFDRLESGLDAKLDTKLDTIMFDAKLATFDAKFAAQMAQIDARIERAQKEMLRLMFFAWMTLLIPIVGLWMRR